MRVRGDARSARRSPAPPRTTRAAAPGGRRPRNGRPDATSSTFPPAPRRTRSAGAGEPRRRADDARRARAPRPLPLRCRHQLDPAATATRCAPRRSSRVIVALGLLEVVLLAGTAFAVGARRQVRELGLVAAAAAAPRDIRRIVLAQGLVLGALGAALGVATGFAVVVAGRPWWERLADAELPGWTFGPWEIAGAALVGLASGLAAAVLPAIGAGRMRRGRRARRPLSLEYPSAAARRLDRRCRARDRRDQRAARRPPAGRRLRRLRAGAERGQGDRRLRHRAVTDRPARADRRRRDARDRRARAARPVADRRDREGRRAPAAERAARRPRRRAPPSPNGPRDERDRRRRHRLGRAGVPAGRSVPRRRAALHADPGPPHDARRARRGLCCRAAPRLRARRRAAARRPGAGRSSSHWERSRRLPRARPPRRGRKPTSAGCTSTSSIARAWPGHAISAAAP